MVSGKIILGTEVNVVMLLIIQYSIQSRDLWEIDWSGGQPQVLVSVVWAVDFLVDIQYALDTKVAQSKNKGGISLQRHVDAESVDVYPRHFWPLIGFYCLRLHNGGQYGNLLGFETQRRSFVFPLLVPESLVFFIHPVKQLSGRSIPIHFIGVGNKHAHDGLAVKAKLPYMNTVGQDGIKLLFSHLQVSGDFLRQVFLGSDVVEGQFYRSLSSGTEEPYQLWISHQRFDFIPSGFDVLLIVHQFCHKTKTYHVIDNAFMKQAI